MTMGLKRLAERALEMKAGFASLKYAKTPAAAKRGRLARGSPAPAAGPASRWPEERRWRRFDNNHPKRVDDVGRPVVARRAPWWTRSEVWPVPASGGRPRSSRCIWPNETIICNASANSAKRPHDRILDRNQCIRTALPPFFAIGANCVAFSTLAGGVDIGAGSSPWRGSIFQRGAEFVDVVAHHRRYSCPPGRRAPTAHRNRVSRRFWRRFPARSLAIIRGSLTFSRNTAGIFCRLI